MNYARYILKFGTKMFERNDNAQIIVMPGGKGGQTYPGDSDRKMLKSPLVGHCWLTESHIFPLFPICYEI